MRELLTVRCKIAHVLPWASIGGTEIQTLRLAEAAREVGYSNVIYVSKGAARVRGLFEKEGFDVFEYDQVQPSYTKPGPFLRSSRALASDLREKCIQILHCADIQAAHFTAFAGRLAHATVVSHVRNHYPRIGLRDKGFLLPAQQFVFVSRATRESFAIRRAKRRSQILYDVPGVRIKPGRDRETARAQFGLHARGYVFGMAARVCAQKDYPTLIEAARLVSRAIPNCAFLIAGDFELETPHREHFQSIQPLLKEAGVRDRFIFAGFQADMTDFFAAIDTFVLSSNWEGLPTVVLEAMMYEKPVVCTEVGGVSEAIVDGVNGFLVPLKSPDVLADRLLRLAADQQLAARMVEGASRSFNDNFGQRRFCEQAGSLYARLLGRVGG